MSLIPSYRALIEHCYYENDFPEEFIDQILKNGICTIKENSIKFNVTGILIYNNTLLILFPKAYKIPESEQSLLEHIQTLFQVLIKYKREADLSPEEMELLGGDRGARDNKLMSAYRLIQDFTQNGLLMKEMRVKTSANIGKTDWPETIAKKQPMFSGGSVVYIELRSRKTTMDRQHLLLKLHKYCLFLSLKKYGILFSLTPEDVEIEEIQLDIDINQAVNVLKNELNSTFIEREINVINMMIDFLLGIRTNKVNERVEVLATPYFQNVWEQVCGSIFNNQYRVLKPIIPNLNWEIESTAVVQPQRPDVMTIKGDVLFILDAKYYNIETNLPGWSDVVKQLFYAVTIFKHINSEEFRFKELKLLKSIPVIRKVENAFLFPSGDIQPIKYVGKVNIEGNKEFDDIKAFRINTFLAMKCYLGKEEYPFLEKLTK